MMLEADVNLGHVFRSRGELVPIMAHPPDINSDLSFKEYVRIVVEVCFT